MFKLIQASLWGNTGQSLTVNNDDYEEMKAQAIVALPASLLPKLEISVALRNDWNKTILQQVAYYANCKYAQSNLPMTVPYVILKGTSAAQYYPHPEYRAMGDIDVMTNHEDFDIAYQELLAGGYKIISEHPREIGFQKNGILVELHRSFASFSEPKLAQYFDDLIIDNINPSHVLPDLINGLVLIEHIYKHLRGGLGLRQIIDWMLFVNRCLPDEKWPDFREVVRKFDLETFTIATTRMCEIYLGLPDRNWCKNADEELCNQLMEYVLNSGNFGNKRTDDSSKTESVIVYARTPKATFKMLQKQGLINWKSAQKHKFLRPFAWIYQAGRYIIKGIWREDSLKTLRMEYSAAQKRKAMFDALGVSKSAEECAVFKDGHYVRHTDV